MYLTTLPISEAVGHILRHNLADATGRKALPKGRRLTPDDIARLRELGLERVRVAVLDPADVHEDEAARRLAAAVAGPGLTIGAAAHSRVNLLAATDGIVRVNVAALEHINDLDGLTVATRLDGTLVRAGKRVATIKIIPFAVPQEVLTAAEASIDPSSSIIAVQPLRATPVGVVLVGSAAARPRIERGVLPAIEARVTELGSHVLGVRYAPSDEVAVADAIGELRRARVSLLIIAGETSVMDRDDVTPQAIRLAGGRIEHYGAPVEPGNLLLLAYIEAENTVLPVLGAPGCVRSRDTNIVDLVLPRLLAGEIVRRRDIVALGHGGLLGA